MSISLYDKALLDKINNWCAKSPLHVYGPDDSRRLFETLADESGDKPIDLPLINLCRDPFGYTIKNTNRKPMTFDGVTKDATLQKSLQINAIPISIKYRLDIYTRYYTEADEFVRNFIFNIVNFPKVSVIIPYHDEDIVHNSSIHLLPDVSDNSDIPERLIKGQFTRMSLWFELDDAYLWDIRIRDNKMIDPTVIAE